MAPIEGLLGGEVVDKTLHIVHIRVGLFEHFQGLFQRTVSLELIQTPRREKYLEGWKDLFGLLGQLKTAESGHHHVGDEHVRFLDFDLTKGHPRVARDEDDAFALTLEDPLPNLKDLFTVIDDDKADRILIIVVFEYSKMGHKSRWDLKILPKAAGIFHPSPTLKGTS